MSNDGARIIARRIRERRPTFYVRIGDGAVECILGRSRAPHTCDRELYTPELGKQLKHAIELLKSGGNDVLWGDWRHANGGSHPTYVEEWWNLIDGEHRLLVDYEALLLMREDDDALVEAYSEIRWSYPGRKLYIGRDAPQAAQMLDCRFIHMQMVPEIDIGKLQELIGRHDPDMVLFGAGMGGLVAVVNYWAQHRDVTCIHLGSALDPLYHPLTRAGQLSQAKARKLMERI